MAKKKLTQSFNQLQEIINQVANKVDKEEGKHLSSNDYTDEEKSKVEGSQRCFNNETPATPKEGDIRVVPASETEVEYTLSGMQMIFTVPQDKVIRVSAPEDAESMFDTYAYRFNPILYYQIPLESLPREFAAGEIQRIDSVISTAPGAKPPVVKAVNPERREEYINGQWVSRSSIATTDKVQGYHHNTTPVSPKEGDICEYDEAIKETGLETKTTDYALADNTGNNVFKIYIPDNVRQSLWMYLMIGYRFGTVKLYTGIYNELNGSETPDQITVGNANNSAELIVTTKDGATLRGASVDLPAYFTSPWSGVYGCMKVEEVLETGQTSLLQYLKIDLVTPRYTQEYKDGAWFKRSDFPVAFDKAPSEGSKNLINSGGVFDAVKDRQAVYTVEPSAVTSPKEGDICVVSAREVRLPETPTASIYSFDLSPYQDNKIKVEFSGATLYAGGQITVTHSDTTTETLTIDTDLPITYEAGEIVAIDGSSSVLTYGINVYRLVEAGVYEYINGQWLDRGTTSPDAVKYSPQTLTEAQKSQARANLDLYRDKIDDYKVEAVGTPLAQVGFMQSGMQMAYNLFQSYKNGETTEEVPTADQLVAVGKYKANQNGALIPITSEMILVKSAKTYMIKTYGSGTDYGAICVTQGNDTITLGNIQISTLTFTQPGVYILGYSVVYDAYGLYWETSEAVKIPQRFLPEIDLPGKQDKMVMLEYNVSTWQQFLDAYNKNAVVYCVASGRLAFMAYTDFTSATSYVEFHYYRSVDTKNASAQHDQVIIYKLTSSGVWSTITREVMLNIVNGDGIDRSVANGNMTLSVKTPSNSGLTVNSNGVVVTKPVPSPAAEDNGKVLGVIDANGTIGWKVAESINSVILSVGSNTGTPSGTASVSNGVLTINLDGIIGPPGQSAIRTRIDYAANENTQVGLAWDTVHKWPEISSLSFTLAAVPNDGVEHTITLVFDTPSDVTNFALNYDQNVLWGAGNNLPSNIDGSKRYEVNIESASMIALYTVADLPSNS